MSDPQPDPRHAGRPTFDFDHHDPAIHGDRIDAWATLRERCPVAWNPNHGGFWMVAGHREVAEVSRDATTYSSRYEPDPVDGITYVGITGVPRSAAIPKAGIAEVEGPVHLALRRVMNPYMVPRAVEEMRPLMERAATWFLDEHIESGAMDLVDDFASPVPAVMTMDLVGLPLDSWEHYAELFHGAVAHDPADPDARATMRRHAKAIAAELDEVIAARRDEPADDLISELLQLEVDGERLDDAALQAVLRNLIAGGLDTTTSLTALALHHLALHPDQRQRLIDEPELTGPATEEFLRYFSVNETLTRTVTCPASLGGQSLEAGEPLMLSWLSANRDATVFERPDEVVLDREANPHLAFGVGPHRCIGLHIARTLFVILLREVLDRIPDYVVDEERTTFYRSNPEMNGVVRLPVTFTPGPRRGPGRPF